MSNHTATPSSATHPVTVSTTTAPPAALPSLVVTQRQAQATYPHQQQHRRVLDPETPVQATPAGISPKSESGMGDCFPSSSTATNAVSPVALAQPDGGHDCVDPPSAHHQPSPGVGAKQPDDSVSVFDLLHSFDVLAWGASPNAPPADQVTAFHSQFLPPMPLRIYAHNLAYHSGYGPLGLRLCLALIARRCARVAPVDTFQLHRLTAAAMHVAVKTMSDTFVRNDYFASVAGLPLREFNNLEVALLQELDFCAIPTPHEYGVVTRLLDAKTPGDVACSLSDA